MIYINTIGTNIRLIINKLLDIIKLDIDKNLLYLLDKVVFSSTIPSTIFNDFIEIIILVSKSMSGHLNAQIPPHLASP